MDAMGSSLDIAVEWFQDRFQVSKDGGRKEEYAVVYHLCYLLISRTRKDKPCIEINDYFWGREELV